MKKLCSLWRVHKKLQTHTLHPGNSACGFIQVRVGLWSTQEGGAVEGEQGREGMKDGTEERNACECINILFLTSYRDVWETNRKNINKTDWEHGVE